MNPLVPTSIDTVLALISVAHLVLAIVALVLLTKRRKEGGVLTSILLIVLVPVAGPVLWMASGRTRRLRQSSSGASSA